MQLFIMSLTFESVKYFTRHQMIFSSMATQIRIVRQMDKDLAWEHSQTFNERTILKIVENTLEKVNNFSNF